MDELTNLIKAEIKRQYRSVRHFSMVVGMPQSTVVTALNKGVSGTAFESVLRICNTLGIKLSIGETSVFMDEGARDMLEQFSVLDEKGRHTIKTVLYAESLRCQGVDLPKLASVN